MLVSLITAILAVLAVLVAFNTIMGWIDPPWAYKPRHEECGPVITHAMRVERAEELRLAAQYEESQRLRRERA